MEFPCTHRVAGGFVMISAIGLGPGEFTPGARGDCGTTRGPGAGKCKARLMSHPMVKPKKASLTSGVVPPSGRETSSKQGTGEAASSDVPSGPNEAPTVELHGAPLVVVALGASAGGLDALEGFFAKTPTASGLAFVVVQHLGRNRPSLLAELLRKHAAIPVLQVEDGLQVEPDHVYVLPPGVAFAIKQGIFSVGDPVGAGTATPIDAFFTSLAEDMGEAAVGVLLSGTGSDGTEGLRAIRDHGGLTVAQSPESAKYDTLPRSAIDAGLVDIIADVDEMQGHLLEHQRHRATATRPEALALDTQVVERRDRICAVVLDRTGHDFRHYKDGTLLRRIRRRLQLRHATSVDEYLRCLETDPREANLLLKDLLIGVTQFFRDPDAFRVLAETVLPALIDGATARPLRIWVPGCSSGEEAYSLAMIVRELLGGREHPPVVQIFATDIDADVLAQALDGPVLRGGRRAEIAPERLARFFVHEKGAYQASLELREMCVFSEHSLIRDPPFSSLDLISCRNVLIYLDANLQRKLVPLFHYALRAGGVLFLGPSEGLAAYSDLFRAVDKKHRIFQRKEAAVRPTLEFPLPRRSTPRASLPPASGTAPAAPPTLVSHAFERMLLEEHLPPCAVVNEQGEILASAGRVSRYLRPPVGATTNNLLDHAQGKLRIELRTALLKVVKTRRNVVRRNIAVEARGERGVVHLTLRPLPGASHDAGLYAVLMEEPSAEPDVEGDAGHPAAEDTPLLSRLEDELHTTRADLQSVVEELESSNEELKSSNEELISTNEELQSSNEELHTSKEEIQAINDELQRKVDELAVVNADLQNLFASTHIATLFLDGSFTSPSSPPRRRRSSISGRPTLAGPLLTSPPASRARTCWWMRGPCSTRSCPSSGRSRPGTPRRGSWCGSGRIGRWSARSRGLSSRSST